MSLSLEIAHCRISQQIKGTFFLIAAAFLLFFGYLQPVSAQSINATLKGTVADSSGAVISGAELTLLEPSTGQVIRRGTSQANGDFEFDEIKPGTYKLQSNAKGFKSFVAQDIILDGGQIRRVDPLMAVGNAVDEVTVDSGAAVISTESATITDMFTAAQHDESPQVTIYPSTNNQLTTLVGVQGGAGSLVANGEQQSQQTQTFDGIPNDLQGVQNNNSNFFEQVSATTFNAPAESPVPIEINQVTKRGANAFHGRATYRIFSSALQATSYFNTSKTPYLQHEWDLEATGPVWKDRTFFFGGWFSQRIPLGNQNQANVPTTDWRNGVFSTTIIDPGTGLPFANNTIPTSRISSVSTAIQNNYLPAPNVNTNVPVNNYSFYFPFNSDLYKGDWPIARIDHNLTKNNTLFVRWLMRQTPYVLNNGLPSLIWTRQRKHQQWAAGDTHVFSARLVNNFRFGYSTDNIVDGLPEHGVTPPNGSQVLSKMGLEGSNPSQSIGQGFPSITISGLTALTDVAGGVKANNHILTFNNTVDWQHGLHAVKFGGNVEHYSNFYGFVNDYGTLTFNGTYTGNAYADFLLGLPQQTQRTSPLSNQTQTLTEYGLFAQDSFTVTHKLNLSYGVRWDLYGTPTSTDHLMYNFDPSTPAGSSAGIIVDPAGLSKVSSLYPTNLIPVTAGSAGAISDKSDFVPRIGAAYRLNDHSVIHAGYSIYTTRLGGATFNNFEPINPQLGSTGPFSISQVYNNVVTPGQAPLLSFPNPYPSSTSSASVPSQSVNGYPRNISHGHLQQFGASYEYEIKHIGLRASYLGSRGSGIDYSLNVNLPQPSLQTFTASLRPYPNIVDVNLLRFDGGTHFNGLQFAANRRAGSLTFDGSYSYSRSMANYLDTQNPYDVLSHWTNDGVTRRHYASASMIWALPFGKGHRYLGADGRFVDSIVGGWSTSVLTYLASGLWFSPSFDGPDPSNTGTFGGLPDLVGNPNNVPGGKKVTDWFNTAAFAIPQTGHFGNALPNSLESQHFYMTHVSLSKTVAITNRVKFKFNTQISNVFNHPQFNAPSGDISAASGNQFTSQFGTFDSLEGGQIRQITFQGGFVF
jgi:hypothetical protein